MDGECNSSDATPSSEIPYMPEPGEDFWRKDHSMFYLLFVLYS